MDDPPLGRRSIFPPEGDYLFTEGGYRQSPRPGTLVPTLPLAQRHARLVCRGMGRCAWKGSNNTPGSINKPIPTVDPHGPCLSYVCTTSRSPAGPPNEIRATNQPSERQQIDQSAPRTKPGRTISPPNEIRSTNRPSQRNWIDQSRSEPHLLQPGVGHPALL